ncbi:MAG: hypothetical protein K9K66_04515 [Desulfarculaceae bacterium]|nr:hypothetical protein [Desulfarculaceae bacterium]MCF8073307.1 hypothetical protein [Desulfarculaceae bacterium]MCF8100903.1 hypothetical protein [Desulfarculaceae bacterium]MCF8116641.1 hypothetical protein [Desulfarculaceae bacterium]
MLIKQGARHGRDYFTGQVGFTCWPDEMLTSLIAHQTDVATWDKDLVVATHALLVAGPDTVIEAHKDGVGEAPIRPLLDNRECLFWVRKIRGVTEPAVAEMLRIARGWAAAKIEYDTWAVMMGFPSSDQDGADGKPNPYNDPDKLFCSELVFKLIKRVNHLLEQPLPAEVLAWPEGFVSPDKLFDFPIWEQA